MRCLYIHESLQSARDTKQVMGGKVPTQWSGVLVLIIQSASTAADLIFRLRCLTNALSSSSTALQ